MAFSPQKEHSKYDVTRACRLNKGFDRELARFVQEKNTNFNRVIKAALTEYLATHA